MFDESTDVSVHQNLIMYIRLLEKDELGNSEPSTYFLSIDSLHRANAECIYQKILDTLKNKGITLTNLCGISTDGASVMLGTQSGVVARLKSDVPGILSTHCIAHRLALSCCTGADAIPYLVKVQEILNSIYKYFHYSPKRTSMLESVQKSTQCASSKFKEVFHTRWLSFHGSVEALLKNYGSLVSVFLEENSGKALSMYKPITCYKFLHVVHFLCDVLQPLSILSKMYQTKDLDFTEVTPMLAATIEKITRLTNNTSGKQLSYFLSVVPSEPVIDGDGLCTFEFEGHIIRDGQKQREEAVSACKKFGDGMVKSLNDRFSDNNDSCVLTSLSNFFNPIVKEEAKGSDVVALVDYLGTVGYEGCKEELELFLSFLHSLIENGNKSIVDTKSAANLALKKADLYPAAAEAAGRLLVAPVSTVECERGFSKQNLVKTCLRNKMSASTLDRLMRISLDCRSVEQFPYNKAFEKWVSLKTRRILQ